MGIPNMVTGYSIISQVNVFRLTFSEALSAQPRWEAYDNAQSFPLRDEPGSTVAKKIFIGTTANGSRPMLMLAAQTSGAQTAWPPNPLSGPDHYVNRLKGTDYYVTDPTTPTAGGSILFNMTAEIPNDLEPSDNSEMNHVLQCRYFYTTATPTLTWSYNEGSEATPTWISMLPGTNGIRHCSTGAVATEYYAEIPYTGVQNTNVGWVT